jgi:alkanesulfonate monooxygenase SsuD/methylene tetrahydromethanopterin reductase-like flavin-dependent oxidoreductase (luciferase family)
VGRISAILRLNMSGHAVDGAAEADRYGAALDMAAYADTAGFAVVNVEEHHDSAIGWLPSPLVMAALIIGRTSRVQVRASALLAPLYDPIRLAEDIAILDLASRGRFSFVLGQGYRPEEYHALDRDWAGRGAQTELVIETLLAVWRGDPIEYRGRMVHVSPRPYTQPHPPFYVGGMSATAVKRAARFGLPYFPPQSSPEVEALYLEESARFGRVGVIERHDDLSLLLIDDDPDRAWQDLGPYLLREAEEYARWTRAGVIRHYESAADSVAALRAQKVYEIITPEECRSRAAARSGYRPILHPLAGGIPAERGWKSLRLFVDRVLTPMSAACAPGEQP